MPPALVTNIVQDMRVGNARKRTVKITKPKGTLTTNDIVGIFNNVRAKYANNNAHNKKFMIRAMAPDGLKTFKGYYTDFDIQDVEDYYEGKVKDPHKFDKFSYVEVSVAFDE